jgi:hypothetical protein
LHVLADLLRNHANILHKPDDLHFHGFEDLGEVRIGQDH